MRQSLDQLIPADWYKALAERDMIPQIEQICEKVEELRSRKLYIRVRKICSVHCAKRL